MGRFSFVAMITLITLIMITTTATIIGGADADDRRRPT